MTLRRLVMALSLLLVLAAYAPPAAAQWLSSGPTRFAPTVAPRVISIWGGARTSIVLESDGTVWDWGMNDYGKLGNGLVSAFTDTVNYINGTQDQHTPLQVHGPGNIGYLNSVTAIMGGESHNFALKSDGSVWAWGWNINGQLGDNTTIDRNIPVRVLLLSSPFVPSAWLYLPIIFR
jgi:hypothetical protein